ncbi:uncharacterized protein si:dkey-24l11.2 [Osmerus eperlanus]|uniref:uncharacterized protein si:dkey-24l11.2 n=1 Tax=Osmerus eperlanus TaxID=29151 RepID=UPI002E12E46F
MSNFEASALDNHGLSASLSHKEKENQGQTDPARGGPQPACRFFAQGRHCNFGSKCRFLHQKRDVRSAKGELENGTNRQTDQGSPIVEVTQAKGSSSGEVGHRPGSAKHDRANRRPCRYFLSGFCSMEDKCRFWHPEHFSQFEIQSVQGYVARARPSLPSPCTPHEVRLSDLTDHLSKQLRDTEIKQMTKRFPKEQLIVQERGDGQVTFYRFSIEATDPDWPFDLKEVDVMVSFPEKYPQEIFTIDIPQDQDLPSIMGQHVQRASLEWLQAKQATNQLMGKVELLFRPFLRWLDRSLERLFTEGARLLKKNLDVARAGLEFVPFQQLQAAVCKEQGGSDTADPVTCTVTAEEGEEKEGTEEEGVQDDPGCDDQEEEEEGGGPVENIKTSNPRRGTEVKLLGLTLGEQTATVVARQITLCLQCNRCKVMADLTLSAKSPCTAQCERCSSGISAAFRPSMLHHYSDVLGYLDLSNAVPVDLILQDCALIVGCLSCSQEGPLENLSYGQSMAINCQHCHSKLSILVDSTRFQYIPPCSKDKLGQGNTSLNYRQSIRDPAVQLGKPLPGKGSCKHYKQSHRWLRFPCCGRAYPCDVCHDEDQDHLMELASRMICGHCAKEQPYSNGKPCVCCGGMMTRGACTSYWEGGLGCRNKIKMNRNDRHKYANISKTVSRKAASEKK